MRDYQREAVNAVLTARARRETCGLVSIPTGGGKTVVAAAVLRRLPGRALVVAHTHVLVEQLQNAFAGGLGERVGIVLEGRVDGGDRRIIVAARQSLTPKRLAAIAAAGLYETLVVDEAHHASDTSTYAAIVDALTARNPKLFTFGLTATPWHQTKTLLWKHWWCSREMADLIPIGVLAPMRHASVELPLSLRDVRATSSADYSLKEIEPRLLRVANETAARTAALLDRRHHIVAFAATVKHAQTLAAAFDSNRISAVALWGEMPAADRHAALARWRAGKVRALVNVGIVTEGFDEPRISAIVMARPTTSTQLYVQCVGRGVRTAPGKRDCLIVDCVGLGQLRDARQCVLDAIVPELDALRGTSSAGEQRVAGRRLVAKPSDDGQKLWHKIARDAYTLLVDRNESLYVVRDARSGLYHASYVAQGRLRQRFEPAPFAVLHDMLRAYLRGRKLVFAKRDARWRTLPATDDQLRVLGSLRRDLKARAQIERWNRGRVSSALTILNARRDALALRILPRSA